MFFLRKNQEQLLEKEERLVMIRDIVSEKSLTIRKFERVYFWGKIYFLLFVKFF